jgi:2-dehydropantoate 2-reductase
MTSKMKITICGAGAVGSYLAGRICPTGAAEVSVIARGAQGAAILADGVRVITATEDYAVRPARVVEDASELPEQDIVFVTVKVMAQPSIAHQLDKLLGRNGVAVFAANGVPWWWKSASAAPAALPLLDPCGDLWNLVTPQRTLGCVVYSANEIVAPGVVRHKGNNRWVVGGPYPTGHGSLQRVVSLLRTSGLNGEACPDLRYEILIKLLRNASLNSLCALTRLPVDGLNDDPALRHQAFALMEDVVAVARGQGYDIGSSLEAAKEQLRRGGAEGSAPPVIGVRPSMLQDVLAGRPLEVEAILGQVQALARETDVPCATIDAVLPLLRGLNRSLAIAAESPRPAA